DAVLDLAPTLASRRRQDTHRVTARAQLHGQMRDMILHAAWIAPVIRRHQSDLHGCPFGPRQRARGTCSAPYRTLAHRALSRYQPVAPAWSPYPAWRIPRVSATWRSRATAVVRVAVVRASPASSLSWAVAVAPPPWIM